MEKVRLSDIARKVKVTPSTVQRALNNLPGVSEKKRLEIQHIAKEMGYQRNYNASSLKKGAINIALVLPEQRGDNQYYAKFLWEGSHSGLSSLSQFNIRSHHFQYKREENTEGKALEKALEAHGKSLDGILTMGTNDPIQIAALEKAKQQSIPVVLVGTDSPRTNLRIACVQTNDEMAGRMAADLLMNFGCCPPRSHIVLSGDFLILDQYENAQGFEKQVLESGFPLEIIKLAHNPNLDAVKESIKEILQSGLGVRAIYSCSARNTVAMCQAVIETGAVGSVKMIGSDIFPESIQFIKSGILPAAIHKRPAMQASTAVQLLVNYIIKKPTNAPSVVLVDSVIAMKSNIDTFG